MTGRGVGLVLLFVASIARADSGFAVTVEAGATWDRSRNVFQETDSHWGPSLTLIPTFRIRDDLAVGIRASATRNDGTESENRPPCGVFTFSTTYSSDTLGATAQYTVVNALWIAPWVGL